MTFEEAYEEYYEVVYKSIYMRMLSRENTEDVVQETFIRAMNSWSDFDESKSSAKTWLCTIAKNTMINYIRNNKKHDLSSFDEMNEAGFEPGSEDKELQSLIDDDAREAYELLKPLKPQDREILIMRYVEEMSYKEIAEKVGSNDKAVAKKVERLLKKCREMNLKGSAV
jgi:RNA polymerase sigma-70 factor (ECF subfamily)